ncbi:hypothetical protein [Flammeovirga sp. SubArs3]|uniref:hypothetical protein n=1 Tax=Flammeovirga sp. SubArs3 TaxID=2995316 RepID=UPI00248BD67D|nr:hypothetical protein [Flammeovirga sp. SubArs3]
MNNTEDELKLNGVIVLACLFFISLIAGFVVYFDDNFYLGELLISTAVIIFIALVLSALFEKANVYIFGLSAILYPFFLLYLYYSDSISSENIFDVELMGYVIFVEYLMIKCSLSYWRERNQAEVEENVYSES